jgi:hypothetical protein
MLGTQGEDLVMILPVVVSAVALFVSCVALWKGHLAPFSPIAVAGNLVHRIYPIRSETERWFISSFDLPLSVTNPAARPGLVTGLRLRLHYPDLPIPGNYELVYPIWELRPDKVNRIGKDRFTWTEEAVAAHWAPFVVLPKTTVAKHLLFEVRWEEPVIQPRITVTLELQTDGRSKWLTVSTWEAPLLPLVWNEMADMGRGFAYSELGRAPREPQCSPSDLHKYTGNKAALPAEGFVTGTTHLDYPEPEEKGTPKQSDAHEHQSQDPKAE